MTERHAHFEVYSTGIRNFWYWRFRAANGKIQADSGEGFPSQRHVIRALKRYINNLVRQGQTDSHVYVYTLDRYGCCVKRERWYIRHQYHQPSGKRFFNIQPKDESK